jgi:tryptophanyl-tRNA synthetase
MLFERIDREIAPMREKYDALMAHPEQIEATLQRGAEKARALSQPLMAELKSAVGLRNLAARPNSAAKKEKKGGPTIKQYREKDGTFRYKLVDAAGRTLYEARFETPREAGEAVARAKAGDISGYAIALEAGVTDADVKTALAELVELAKA